MSRSEVKPFAGLFPLCVSEPAFVQAGKDLTNTLNYFGSADNTFLEKDFSREQQRDFTIRKEIIWESETASDREVNQKEVELINQYKSNDPAVGYNR